MWVTTPDLAITNWVILPITSLTMWVTTPELIGTSGWNARLTLIGSWMNKIIILYIVLKII